jgi:hypothetical protein
MKGTVQAALFVELFTLRASEQMRLDVSDREDCTESAEWAKARAELAAAVYFKPNPEAVRLRDWATAVTPAPSPTVEQLEALQRVAYSLGYEENEQFMRSKREINELRSELEASGRPVQARSRVSKWV